LQKNIYVQVEDNMEEKSGEHSVFNMRVKGGLFSITFYE